MADTNLEALGFDFSNGRLIRGQQARENYQLIREEWENLGRVGWEKATVVNCLNFPLTIRTTYGYFSCPAPDKKKNELFRVYTIHVPSMGTRDMGEGRQMPTPIMPIVIATEFCNQYKQQGGVFCFKGEQLPENIGALVAEAHEKMEKWYWNLLNEGNSNWAAYRQNPRYITDRMRDAAKFLFERAKIAELPQWVTASRQDTMNAECPHCAEIVRKGAKVCKHCHLEIEAGYFTKIGQKPKAPVAANAKG